MTGEVPFVTVLIPARNEEADIAHCLEHVLAQDHPHDRMEIVLVDGGSTDATVGRAEHVLAAGDVVFKIVDNPVGTTPSNLNIGLETALGEYICRVDARSLVPPDYVRVCTSLLASSGSVRVVGGRQLAVARANATVCSRSIVRGLNNRWGTGLARYRRGAASGPTDTVYLGTFRAAELREAGGWNDDLHTNQDFELNRRMGMSGLIWFEDRLVVGYLPRDRFRDLARQYVRFGRWKVRYWRLLRARPTGRQVVLLVIPPAAAVGATLVSRRHPALAILAALAGAIALDVSGTPERAPMRERIGGVTAVMVIAVSWWWGVVRELTAGG